MTTRIITAHVLDGLAMLPPESVHCVVTSPPYYGLRDYGIESQLWPDGWRGSLGLEPTLDLYLDHMVDVFRAVRRVLRKDGTCWLNIGDSYAGSWGAQSRKETPATISRHSINNHPKAASHTGSILAAGLKPKDLMLIPSRLAIRLQEDGWWVRSDIAWCKRAPMPESCTDRPTTAWEHVFLLTRSSKYFYDAEAVKEEAERAGELPGGNYVEKGLAAGVNGGWAGGQVPSKRNMRNFWLLGPSPYPEAHFATFPPEIPRRAILAGTSERGVCPKCGAPWARVTKSSFVKLAQRRDTRKAVQPGADMADINSRNEMGYNETETIGWFPTCECAYNIGDYVSPIPATVLDPFLGAGTTALVADQLQRDCIGIELSPKYAEMARLRITEDNSLFSEIAAE